MAINLTPEQLAAAWQQIQPQMRSGATGYGFNLDGRDYMATPVLNAQTQVDGYVGGMTPEMLDEWRVYEGKGPGEAEQYNGVEYDRIDPRTGENLGSDTWSGLGGMSLAEGLAFLAAFGLGGNALGAALGGTGGMFGSGGVFGSGAGANGAFLGEGVMSGTPSWDAAMANALSGSYGPAGLEVAMGNTLGTGALGAGNGLGTMEALAPYTSTLDHSVPLLKAGAGSGLLSNLGSWGPLLAAGAGALAGSQENDQASTQERRMDPRLDPYFFGNGGLLNIAQQQLQKDLADRRGADAMKQMGLGLLSRPVAGNGFQLLTGRSIG